MFYQISTNFAIFFYHWIPFIWNE